MKKAIKQLSNESLPKEQQYNQISLLLNQYSSDNGKLNNLVKRWKELNQPSVIRTSIRDSFLTENKPLKEEYQKYLDSLKQQPTITINKEIWDKYASAPRISSGTNKENLYELVDERVKRILGSYEPPRTREEEISEPTKTLEPMQSTFSNKYDDLLTNLEGEEKERERKRLEREASRRKLEEAELTRRQSKL